MAGYTRQSSAQILSGEIVSAAPINAEYNQILNAFDESTGHKHDGTSAEGPPIDRIADADQNNKVLIDTSNNHIEFYIDTGASTEQVRIQDGAIVPITDNDIDLGTSSLEFKDLYIDGTANIDTLATSLIVVDAGTAGAPSITTTGDTDNGLFFNAANQMSYTSGGTAQITFKDGSVVPVTDDDIDLGASGAEFKDLYIDGTANIDSLVADTADINGGTIDATVIGGTTAAAGTFTNMSATGTSTIVAGTINNTVIGGTTAAAGTFTTVNATTVTGTTVTDGTASFSSGALTGATTGSFSSNVTVGGNLTVNGTTTTVNSTTVTVDDPIFTVGGDTPPGADDNKDRGVEFRWHNGSAAKTGFFGFDDSTGYFTFIPDGTNTSEVYSGTLGTLEAGGVRLSGTTQTVAYVPSSVSITGGSITGITDLAVADGGTGASTASDARTNLGVAIGSDVQAYDAGLLSIAGLTTAANKMIYTTASDTYAVTDLTAAGRALIDDADASAQRTTLGLGTIATQDANNVNITGGTITGITSFALGSSVKFELDTTTTDADPGSGKFRFNNTNQNTATELYIDDLDDAGTNIETWIQGFSLSTSVATKGLLYIREEQVPNNFLAFKVTAVSNETGYTKLTVSNVASSATSPFANTDKLLVAYSLTGDKGDAGSLTGPGSSTDNAVVRFDGTSGGLAQDSSVLIADDGSMIISGSSSGDMLRITQTGAGNALKVEDSTNPDSTPFVVNASGNVGIGTSSPTHMLTVGEDGSNNPGQISLGRGGLEDAKIFFTRAGNNDAEITYNSDEDLYIKNNFAAGDVVYSNNLGEHIFKYGSAGAAEAMRIDSSGNVGIGTSSPALPLHISSATPAIRLTDTDDNSDAQVSAAAGGLLVLDADIGNEVAGTAILFRVDGGSEKMRIDSSGNVGIGTASPDAKLGVYSGSLGTTDGDQLELARFISAASNGSYLRVFTERDGDGTNWTTAFTRIQQRVDTTDQGYIQFNGADNLYGISIGNNNTEYMRIENGGNVGIGTSSPAAALDVSGTARATQGMPIITEAGTAKTLALTDNGGYVRTTSGSAVTITVPLNSSVAFPTGAEIVVFQDGAGLVTFAATGGVTIKSKDSNLSLGGQYSAATLKKVATDTWDLIGDLA